MCDAVNDNQGRVNNPGTKVLHQQPSLNGQASVVCA